MESQNSEKLIESQPSPATVVVGEDGEKNLKYLEFVQSAAIYLTVCFCIVYDYAKENSGPLKPGVQTVEGTVKTVVGPVYDKFHDVPMELLRFVDRKVDNSLREVERHVPSLVKQASSRARAVACEVQRAGVVGAAKSITQTVYSKYEPAAKELYGKYEPVAEVYAVSAWRSLNRLPLFAQVAHIAVPTGAYWAERYNQAVSCTAERGYAAAEYLPLIPVERIAKVFDHDHDEDVNVNGGPTVSSTNGEAVKAH